MDTSNYSYNKISSKEYEKIYEEINTAFQEFKDKPIHS